MVEWLALVYKLRRIISFVKKVIVLNKKEGETPLLALESFRRKNPEYLNLPMTYAGRLDPMASGVLVVLTGEETKNKDKYLALDKEYDFSVLFGFSTDTYDILGKVAKVKFYDKDFRNYLIEGIENNLKYFRGGIRQKYPIYSSKTVNGKPLFSYARNKEDVEIPEKIVSIKTIVFKKIRKISWQRLYVNIGKRIKKVKGDFRQAEILEIWKGKLSKLNKKQIFYIADFKIKCTSGTYVRGLANSLGEKVKVPAIAFSIKRLKVGKFSIK